MAAMITKTGMDITYTPKGGGPAAIKAVVGPINPSIMEAVTPGDYLSMVVACSDVPNPVKGDTAVVGGETLYVAQNNGGGITTGTWELILSRSGRRIA